jgi:hypothetical protein
VAAGIVASATLLFGGLSGAPAPASADVHKSSGNGVYAFGDARAFGGPARGSLRAPIVAMAPTRNGRGYSLLGRDGGVFSYGNAKYYGSTGNLPLRQPVVGMAATRSGRGYWLLASDGGVFSYGDAKFYGSTGNLSLHQPVVGMAPTRSGRGYWFVASDGGIFSFGDAHFYGSTGALRLAHPIVGMAPTPTGRGYWLVASDGGVFAFGDAVFRGSTGGLPLAQPVVGMAASRSGRGYTLVARDGGIFTFGDARFRGSLSGVPLDGATAVGIVTTPTGRGYWITTSGAATPAQLAQTLLVNPRVTKNEGFVRADLEAAARGANASAGDPVDPVILRLLAALAERHSVSISAIESGGRGHSHNSRHFRGKAVDLNVLDGQHVNGRNAPAITIIETVKGLLPPGSRFGQSNCGRTPPLPPGVGTMPDGCNHLHIDVP